MAEAVSGLTTQVASVPVYSTVTGAQATEEDFDAVYWGRNIRQTVRFAAAVRAMLDAGINTFVELSPHPVLSSMVLQCCYNVAAECATPAIATTRSAGTVPDAQVSGRPVCSGS